MNWYEQKEGRPIMGKLSAFKRIVFNNAFRARSIFVHRDPHVWVFGEWLGIRCGDNSTEMANYVANFHSEISPFWIASKTADTSLLDSRITVLAKDSDEALEILKHAGVAFMTHDMKDFSTEGYFYLAGAFIVQLWHGVGWK
ncbi:MAG: hypothetical protein PHX26_11810, partial [Proteiniphilum sp.]|nr:hypothetical protein [Proteiniphilum sp.]